MSEPAHDFLLDRGGLAADVRREVPTPAVVERGHLGEPGGLAVGNTVADPRLEVVGEVFHQEAPWGIGSG